MGVIMSLTRRLSSDRSLRMLSQEQDVEDEGSFDFACEIMSRIISTRVNKFLMNMYKWLLVVLYADGQQGASEI